MRGNQHGTIASMLAGKLLEFQYKTGIRAVSALPSISIIGPEERNSLADYAWRIFFQTLPYFWGSDGKIPRDFQ